MFSSAHVFISNRSRLKYEKSKYVVSLTDVNSYQTHGKGGQNRIKCEKYKCESLTHLSCAVHVMSQI